MPLNAPRGGKGHRGEIDKILPLNAPKAYRLGASRGIGNREGRYGYSEKHR